jgi:hypothetical protein
LIELPAAAGTLAINSVEQRVERRGLWKRHDRFERERIAVSSTASETHPSFSKKYLLRGEDESRIRELFNDDVLNFFETQNTVSVQADGGQFVIYRPKKCIKPDELRQFMDEGLRFFADDIRTQSYQYRMKAEFSAEERELAKQLVEVLRE